jgi:hypothetical protein
MANRPTSINADQPGAVNPTTGRAWSLADPELQERLQRLKSQLKDNPVEARKFLASAGITTASGKLSKRYGG